MKNLHKIAFFVLFVGFYIKSYTQKPIPTQFKIISFNIHHGVGLDGNTNLLKTVEIIKKHQPDIIVFQDIDSNMTRSGKINQLKVMSLLTGYDFVFGGAMKVENGKTGLGLMTKHKIESSQTTDLPMPESSENKAILSVVLQLPNNRTLRVCNTQLDAKSTLNRGVQAAVLNRNLEMSMYPIVFCGDFVVPITDDTVKFLPKKWDDAGQTDDKPTQTATKNRVDYFWTLKGSNVQLCDYNVLSYPSLSDHQPIMAAFELK